MSVEILFVDDDMYFAGRYREVLKKYFTVHYRDRADDAKAYIAEHPDINAIVLDIMMPTPAGVKATVTASGLETGLWLLAELRDTVVGRSLAVMILTNRNPEVVTERLAKLGIPDRLVEVRSKMETPAFFLPEALNALISRAAVQPA